MNKKVIARIKNNEIPVITARDDKDFPFWASFSNPVTKKMSTVFSPLFCTMCYLKNASFEIHLTLVNLHTDTK